MRTIYLHLSMVFLLLCASHLLAYEVIVIDPGHGGPGGAKYGMNGDGVGSEGQQGLTEEWVNLMVALKVDTLILQDASWPWMSGVLTRDNDTTYVPLWGRIQKAKDYRASYFISIHHNGFDSSTQGTEVWWSGRLRTDSLPSADSLFEHDRSPRSRDSTFAKKTLLRIMGDWHDTSLYRDRCRSRNPGSWMLGCDEHLTGEKFVLENLYHCYCALSEASFLDVRSEEALMATEPSAHRTQEASALFHATHSHYFNAGIAEISNRYIGGPGYEVGVDGVVWPAPVEFCWEVFEQHELIADDNFYANGYGYFFHHWAHLSCEDCFIDSNHTSRYYDITVPPEFERHIYRAYFTGGPYWCSIYEPNWGGDYAIGETRWIGYDCTPGVDSTSVIDIYLNRRSGHGGFTERLARDVPYQQGFGWVVSGPPSDSCLMKIVARDIAGNRDSTVSEYPFHIHNPCTHCGDADDDGIISIADAVSVIN